MHRPPINATVAQSSDMRRTLAVHATAARGAPTRLAHETGAEFHPSPAPVIPTARTAVPSPTNSPTDAAIVDRTSGRIVLPSGQLFLQRISLTRYHQVRITG